MPADTGHISWRMPIVSSTPPRAAVPGETPSRVWTPFVQGTLPFEHQSPILPVPTDRDVSGTVSSIAPHISASTSDESLRSSLSCARAELSNSTFQIDHLRKFVLDLEQENARLKSDNSSLQQQQKVPTMLSRCDDASKRTIMLEQELRRLQDELNNCEQRYHEAIAHHRLEKISIEADRDAKTRELKRVQQELEEITVLYKGKDRCLRQLQELHEAQFSKDGRSKAEDKKKLDILTSHCSKLRDALLSLKRAYDAEKTKCHDQQKRIETMKRVFEEANSKYEKCNAELISSREEIDELLTQLSEIDCKRRQAGGDRVHQGPNLKSDAISAMAAAEPARSSTPTNLSGVVNPQPQRVVAYKDASTSTFADTISGTVHPDALQTKLLDTEAQLSSERATICQLRAQLAEMEEREKESEKLCDMLQTELETAKKLSQSYPATGLEKTDNDDSKSTLLELCMDECNQLRRQNSELVVELDRMRNELKLKDEELQSIRVRSTQRLIPLHNPFPSNDSTTVVNESHETSFSQVFSPIAFANR